MIVGEEYFSVTYAIALGFWGHLNFHCYLVKADPKVKYFSVIIQCFAKKEKFLGQMECKTQNPSYKPYKPRWNWPNLKLVECKFVKGNSTIPCTLFSVILGMFLLLIEVLPGIRQMLIFQINCRLHLPQDNLGIHLQVKLASLISTTILLQTGPFPFELQNSSTPCFEVIKAKSPNFT